MMSDFQERIDSINTGGGEYRALVRDLWEALQAKDAEIANLTEEIDLQAKLHEGLEDRLEKMDAEIQTHINARMEIYEKLGICAKENAELRARVGEALQALSKCADVITKEYGVEIAEDVLCDVEEYGIATASIAKITAKLKWE